MSIQEIKNKIKPILKRHDVKKASIFGSYARGEEKKRSDVDILIEYRNDDKSLLDLIDLKLDLEKKLNKKVDLGEFCAIRPRIREKILREQVFIYEEKA